MLSVLLYILEKKGKGDILFCIEGRGKKISICGKSRGNDAQSKE